jgi:hypothetical protein
MPSGALSLTRFIHVLFGYYCIRLSLFGTTDLSALCLVLESAGPDDSKNQYRRVVDQLRTPAQYELSQTRSEAPLPVAYSSLSGHCPIRSTRVTCSFATPSICKIQIALESHYRQSHDNALVRRRRYTICLMITLFSEAEAIMEFLRSCQYPPG